MKPFPTLSTDRLTLRQLSIDDQHDIFALRSDHEINKYLDRPVSKTIEDALVFINKINENLQKNNSFYWAITLTETNSFVGTICLFDFSKEKNSCEIGYELLTGFQGQGIMKEAAEKVIDYVFRTLQCQTILAFTHNENLSSTNLLGKLNFVKSSAINKDNVNFSLFMLHRK